MADAEVLFAGAQGEFVGLDQAMSACRRRWPGAAKSAVALTVDGKTSNTVKARIK